MANEYVEFCSICDRELTHSTHEEWRTSDGAVVNLPVNDEPYVLITRDEREFCVCESCYSSLKSSEYRAEEIAEMHYQFAIEYMSRKCSAKAEKAARNGIAHLPTPEGYAILAQVVEKDDFDRTPGEATNLDS